MKGIARRQASPSGGFHTQIPTSIVNEVTTSMRAGENICAKISPSSMSSRLTRRDVLPAVSGVKAPRGMAATLRPIAMWRKRRKSKATE